LESRVCGFEGEVEEMETEKGEGDYAGFGVRRVGVRERMKGRRGTHGRRQPKAPTTMDLDFRDIWIPHTR
jgi:hypothetical protein